MWSESVLDTIGDTPLVQLNRLGSGVPCTVLAKVEFFKAKTDLNPSPDTE
mgnify:CR=1 FL=1